MKQQERYGFKLSINEVLKEENIGKEFRCKSASEFGGNEINMVVVNTHPIIKLKVTKCGYDPIDQGKFIEECYSLESIINMKFKEI